MFAMWIGFGVYALFDLIKEYSTPKVVAPLVVVIGMLAAPALLISQNWDDHDRSNRFTANSMAKMYLDSCDENSILFTIGDNDTFALWYAQGIEGYRQDIRTVNTSLFQTDWYIDDMKKAAYTSAPIPSQMTHSQYRYGTRDFVFAQEVTDEPVNIKEWLNWIVSDDPRTMITLPDNNQKISTFPSKTVRIPVNKENVLKYGIVDPKDADLIVPYIDIKLNGDVLYKNRLLMLDIIANNDWERPIYFTGGSFGDDDYLWMKDYLQLDGVTYKLVPIKTPRDPDNPYEMGRIDTDKMYDIVTNWDWGNSGSEDIYHDPETRRNALTYRSNLSRLADSLIVAGKNDKAKTILDLAMEKMPVEKFGFYTMLDPYIRAYYAIGENEKAREIFKEVAQKYQEKLIFFDQFSPREQDRLVSDILTDVERYRSLVYQLNVPGEDDDFIEQEFATFNSYLEMFKALYIRQGLFDEDTDDLDLYQDEDPLLIPADTSALDSAAGSQ